MNKSGILVFGIAALFIIFGLFFYIKRPKVEAPTVSTTNPTATTTKSTSSNIAPFVEEHSTTTYATIDLSYPKSSKTEYPEIYAYVQNAKADFIKDYVNVSQDVADMSPSLQNGEKYQMMMSTKVATSSKTVSYIIELYEYTGGAHGGTSVQVFTYNKDKKLVTIQDVFAQPYLPTLSTKAKKYLVKNLADNGKDLNEVDMINVGVAPTEENFGEWYLTDDTITFIFGQYQVGPYVIGMPEFPLQKSEVENLLSSEYK